MDLCGLTDLDEKPSRQAFGARLTRSYNPSCSACDGPVLLRGVPVRRAALRSVPPWQVTGHWGARAQLYFLCSNKLDLAGKEGWREAGKEQPGHVLFASQDSQALERTGVGFISVPFGGEQVALDCCYRQACRCPARVGPQRTDRGQ